MITNASHSVRRRLLAAVLASALPLAGVLCFVWWQSLHEGRRIATVLLSANANRVKGDLEQMLREADWVLRSIAARPEIREFRADACGIQMGMLAGYSRTFDSVTLWKRDGGLVCSSAPSIQNNPHPAPYRPAFDKGLATDGLYLSDVFLGQIVGRPLATFIYPVKDSAGSTTGLVSNPIRLDRLETLLGELRLQPGASAVITDGIGNIAARFPDSSQWRGKARAGAGLLSAVQGSNSGLINTAGVDGVERIYAHTRVQGADWHVFAGMDRDALDAAFTRQLVQGIAVFLVVIGLSLGYAFHLGRRIRRPLEDLAIVSDAVAQGNLALRASPGGDDEIGRMVRNFNRMLDALAASAARVQRVNRFFEALTRTNRELLRLREPDALYRAICRICVEHGHAKVAYIGLIRDGEIVPVAWAGPAERFLTDIAIPIGADTPESRGPIATSIREGAPYVCNDLQSDPGTLRWRERAEAIGSKATAAFPFRCAGHVVGVLSLHVGEVDFFDDELTSLITQIADELSVALDNLDQADAKARAEAALRDSNRRLQELSTRLLHAEENERKRISRELHDQVGQELTALVLDLDSLSRVNGGRPEIVDRCRAGVVHLLAQVRDLTLVLRPSGLDDFGLVVALRGHLEDQVAVRGIKAHFDSDVREKQLPADLEAACFRIAQEALTNVLRHAGAENVWLSIQEQNGELMLEIRDDGKGFDMAAARKRAEEGGSSGLRNLFDRAELAGGSLAIQSEPGRGTKILARLPLVRAGVDAL